MPQQEHRKMHVCNKLSIFMRPYTGHNLFLLLLLLLMLFNIPWNLYRYRICQYKNNCAKHSSQVHIITVKTITLTVTIQEIVDGIHQ